MTPNPHLSSSISRFPRAPQFSAMQRNDYTLYPTAVARATLIKHRTFADY